MRHTQVFLASLCLSPVMLFSFFSSKKEASSSSACGCVRPELIEVKHIEGKGIGYEKGYSTLDGFFVHPSHLDKDWVPFLDLRAHVFNDGQPAVNAGVGLRYLDARVWGANVYYDYRKTTRSHYNQVGVGLESLGMIWDFRINGYFPVGEKHSHPYHFRFNQFKGHRILLKNKLEFAMTGANAEVGAHAYHHKHFDVYAAAGPYYFNGQGRAAWGGEARVALTIIDHLRLQVSGSYDSVFKGIGQGEISLFSSWGGKKGIKHRRCKDCVDSRKIADRALQRVDRQEIIVLDHKHQISKAINPVTGDPYTVWFVNNLSHSLGTFESPFPTLVAAQNASGPNDIIYVYPGDGTDHGMDAGIVLQNGQQLLGAGIDQMVSTTKGIFRLPAQASGLPIISNVNDPSGGLGVQLVAGNNVVAGFNLQDKIGNGIGSFFTGGVTIMGGSNYVIQYNIISTLNFGDGISIFGGGNNTVIQNNLILGTDSGAADFGIYIAPSSSLAPPIGGAFAIINNTFAGINASTGLNQGIDYSLLSAPVTGGLPETAIFISHNTMNLSGSPFSTRGIEIQNPADGAQLSMSIDNNNILLATFSANKGVELNEEPGAAPFSASVTGNVVQNSPPISGYIFTNNAAPDHFQLNFVNNVGTRTGP